MAFTEAKETFGKMIRWTEQPKDQKQAEGTIFLGESVTGYYVNKRDGVGQNSSAVYELKLENGELISFWGSGLLDGKFDIIPLGCMVRVTYKGIAQPKTPAGRAYQNFTVEYDDTARVPMKEAGHPADAPVTTRTGASASAATDTPPGY